MKKTTDWSVMWQPLSILGENMIKFLFFLDCSQCRHFSQFPDFSLTAGKHKTHFLGFPGFPIPKWLEFPPEKNCAYKISWNWKSLDNWQTTIRLTCIAFIQKYYMVQKLDHLTCSKFVITTSLYKPIKLGKLKFVFSPELHYMTNGLDMRIF